jgi:hypothetical protein
MLQPRLGGPRRRDRAWVAATSAPATHILNVTTSTAPIEQSTEYYKQALRRLVRARPSRLSPEPGVRKLGVDISRSARRPSLGNTPAD